MKSKLRQYIENKTDEHANDSGIDYQVGDLLCVIDSCLEQMSEAQVKALVESDSFVESCVNFDKEECIEHCS